MPIFVHAPDPHYGGYPSRWHGPSGAQNLSGGSKFPPGHWALGLQKLFLLRFRFRAWLFLANAPGPSHAPVKPSPSQGEGAPVRTLGRMRVRLSEGDGILDTHPHQSAFRLTASLPPLSRYARHLPLIGGVGPLEGGSLLGAPRGSPTFLRTRTKTRNPGPVWDRPLRRIQRRFLKFRRGGSQTRPSQNIPYFS